MNLRLKSLSRLLPHSRGEKALFAGLVVAIPFSAAWMWLVILPEQHAAVWWHLAAIVFLVYGVVSNMLMVVRVDASGDSTILPVILKPGWRFCHDCQVNSPPRSYHCHQCRACILRRDHHCRFTGCCVGHHNQRFFTVAMLYLLVGLSYGLLYQWPLVYSVIDVSPYLFPMVMFVPHFCWLVGVISVWALAVATIHCFGVAAWVLVLYVLYTQARVIVTGQTQYEAKEGISKYNVGLAYNVRMALGDRWYLVALSPRVVSQLPSDGLDFTTASEHEEVKDM